MLRVRDASPVAFLLVELLRVIWKIVLWDGIITDRAPYDPSVFFAEYALTKQDTKRHKTQPDF